MQIDWPFVKEVLISLSTVFTIFSIGVSALIAVLAYRLNLEAETRLKESAKAEIDVKLVSLMINLAQKANGRGGYEVSHDAIKKVLESEQITKLNWLDPDNTYKINDIISTLSILTYPVGTGEQDLAIRAIGELGVQHESLRQISLTALAELGKMDRAKALCDQLTSTLQSMQSARKRGLQNAEP